MGKKGWFSAVKKAVIRSSKRSHKSSPKISWHENQRSLDTHLSQTEVVLVNPTPNHEYTDLKQPDAEQQQQMKQAYSIASMAEEAEADTKAAEVIRGKSKEEMAAIKIQRAYRGYLARRGLRALRAKRRLKSLIQGLAVKRQTASTLQSMQTMARVQSQVRNRRNRMSEVNQALQRQLHQRLQKELDNIKSSQSGFDLSPKSKEQVEASLQKKKEVAKRRERALAYAHTRQQTWRKFHSLKPGNPPTSTNYWGWSWIERWNAVRPWEPETTSNVGDMGKSPAPLSVSGKRLRSKNDDSKTSTKSMKLKTSTPGPGPGPSPSPLGPKKQAGPNTRLGVGSTKKQLLSSGK